MFEPLSTLPEATPRGVWYVFPAPTTQNVALTYPGPSREYA